MDGQTDREKSALVELRFVAKKWTIGPKVKKID